MSAFTRESLIRLFSDGQDALRRYVKRVVKSRETTDEIVQGACLRTDEQSRRLVFVVNAAMAVIAFMVANVAQAASPAAETASALSCGDVAKLALPNATVTMAESIAAGQYQVPEAAMRMGGRPGMNVAGRLALDPNPEFCRVAVTVKPSSESSIKVEVWLPLSKWNGKLLAIGNFGWGGSLMYAGMLTGLLDGYATVSTDTGHDDTVDGPGGQFALGHPEKLIDYAYRADHEMTIDAKAIVKKFYGRGPARSYWIGCSLGGLEGLIEAKRYPADYDGIVAGAPPNPLARFNSLQLWASWLISQEPSRLIPKDKYTMVHDAVVKQCASPVGQKDNLVEEPDKCNFDPRQLQCKGADAPDCLTAPQVDLLQQTYKGPTHPRTKEVIFPGPARGSELDLFGFASGQGPTVPLDLFRYVVFQDANWDWKTIDWDKDVSAAIGKVGPLMHVDSDLGPFFERGGKLLLYIGWTDYHNPQELIEYYEASIKHSGAEQTKRSLRLFTIPGMGHCAGGTGCDTFNKLGVIDAWVDQGKAPERIVASKVTDGEIVRTRPLCAYPKVAKYQGSGDTNDAANFTCSAE